MVLPHSTQHLDHLVKGAPAPSEQFVNPPPYSALAHGDEDGDGHYGAQEHRRPHTQYTAQSPSAYAAQSPAAHAAAAHAQYTAQTPAAHPQYPPTLPHDRLASLKAPRSYLPADPTSLLPSSPPQIYLNLLILEASLRSQYLTLRARRRQNTFVLTLLAVWIAVFFYALWLRPRDDGKGIGGSGYWLIDMVQKMCFITGLVTALLFWATGQWERGVRWPRRWIGVANRGLRGMNAKIVVMRGGWASEVLGWMAFMMPFRGGLWGGETGGSSYHFVNLRQESRNDLAGTGVPRHRIVEDGKEYAEEDVAAGGDLIKLILLPKPFTPDFREGWEIYRAEYWGRENERRAELRRRIRARQREVARAEGGFLWWTGWKGWKRRGVSARASDVHHAHSHSHSHSHSLNPNPNSNVPTKDRKRRPSTLRGRASSRSSSRSTTPTPNPDPNSLSHTSIPQSGTSHSHSHSRERRWSTSTTGSTSSFTRPARTSGSRKSSVNLGSGPVGSGSGGLSSAGIARQSVGRLASNSSTGSAGGRPSTPNRGSGLAGVENVSDEEVRGFEESVVGGVGG